jgi:hypothetical protein
MLMAALENGRLQIGTTLMTYQSKTEQSSNNSAEPACLLGWKPLDASLADSDITDVNVPLRKLSAQMPLVSLPCLDS